MTTEVKVREIETKKISLDPEVQREQKRVMKNPRPIIPPLEKRSSDLEKSDRKSQTIIRVEHNKENPYIMINRNSLRATMSLAAKGLLAYLLSFPNDWEVNMAHLEKVLLDGKRVIYRCMDELIGRGYMIRFQPNSPNETGRPTFQKVQYIIFEFPLTPEEMKEKIQELHDFATPSHEDTSKEFKKCLPQRRFAQAQVARPQNAPLLNNEEELSNEKEEKTPPPAASAKTPSSSNAVSRNFRTTDPKALELTEFFIVKIRQINPKLKEPDKNKWAKEMDLLLRIDKRDPDEVKEIVQYVIDQDSIPGKDFKWSAVILSVAKLRKHYATLWKQMTDQKNRGEKKDANVIYWDKVEQEKRVKKASEQWAKKVVNALQDSLQEGIRVNATEESLTLSHRQSDAYRTIHYLSPNFQQEALSAFVKWGIKVPGIDSAIISVNSSKSEFNKSFA